MNSRSKLVMVGFSLAAFVLVITFQNCSPKLAVLTTQSPSQAKEKIDFSGIINDSTKEVQGSFNNLDKVRTPASRNLKREKIILKEEVGGQSINSESNLQFSDSKRNPQTYDEKKYQKRILDENTDSGY